MEIIADLHLHSKYSRAVSPQMVIPEIAGWARKKGIDLVGAPDWTHPLFFRELKEELVEAGEGIYKVKSSKLKVQSENVRFLLVTEISSIYSQGGKGRRIHNLIFAPSLGVVEKINQALRNKGVNLLSDGRPITSLSSRELCDLVFSVSKDCLVIPCHAWTPWYSLYGSRSGFDSLKECFGEFSDQIYAIETGLSSDSKMNWRIGELDKRSIVSFSDAHSPAKIGREATVFEIEDTKRLEYRDIKKAIMNGDREWVVGYGSRMSCGGGEENKKPNSPSFPQPDSQPITHPHPNIAYTIEFYPQEGKYHYTGHRKCGVRHSPEETRKLGKTCPVCGRRLTVGVMHRVEELAIRSEEKVETKEAAIGEGLKGIGWQDRPPYVMLVPLVEILSESLGSGVSSQIVQTEYNRLVSRFDSEFNVLLNAKIEKIAEVVGEKVTEGILRVRSGQVVIDPGYDGVFGKVRIWGGQEKKETRKQMSLF